MLKLTRSQDNPILQPDLSHPFEQQAVFNGCPVVADKTYHLFYRALSFRQHHAGHDMELSTIGHATSTNGLQFKNRTEFIKPEHDWERFGCEDPRVTELDGTYYIFYTALSTYPFTPGGIQIAVAVTKDFKHVEKHEVTPFNSKAMALFPNHIDDQLAAVLTVNTDIPPSEIAIAFFDEPEEIWSYNYWDNWYGDLKSHTIPLLRSLADHIEVGVPPIETGEGWLLIYSYIKEYQSNSKVFTLEAVLLDLEDPRQIIARLPYSLLSPEMPYEKFGVIPNIVFPSGALVKGDTLSVYYGAADTVCAVATCSMKELLKELEKYPA